MLFSGQCGHVKQKLKTQTYNLYHLSPLTQRSTEQTFFNNLQSNISNSAQEGGLIIVLNGSVEQEMEN